MSFSSLEVILIQGRARSKPPELSYMNRFNSKACLKLVISFSGLLLSTVSVGQTVTVRVIDSRNGQPFQKKNVSISLIYERSDKSPAKQNPALSLQTDGNGTVEFSLPEPAPEHLGIHVQLTSEHLKCGCDLLVATKEVLNNGLAGPPPDGNSKKSRPFMSPHPGEVLVFARPLTLAERLLYPLVKG